MSQRESSSSLWRKILQWPAFLAANLAILLLVGISTVRETYRGWTIEREIHALEVHATQLEGRKLQLMELTTSLGDPEHIEMEAKSRLGWKKDGERVVVLTGWQAASTTRAEDGVLIAHTTEREPASNPRQWVRYFFHPL